MTGAMAASEANEASRTKQSRFRSEYSGWNSPSAEEPYRMTLTRLAPAASRNFSTNSLSNDFSAIVSSRLNGLFTNHLQRRRRRLIHRRTHQSPRLHLH